MENHKKALFIVINAGFAEEIVAIARGEGATGATILNARGEGLKSKTILGITVDSEKEIVFTLVTAKVANRIMEAVRDKAGVRSPAHGVCFVMPVEGMTETMGNLDAEGKL